mmetsp:Transcript_58000/g.176694  ORF Transcript_58000/g.176694 Transcript_58000/m.176694 type:complete len:344 (-) Transcript_58000:151-1182(-)
MPKLRLDRLVIADGVLGIGRHDVDEGLAPLDVAKELDAHALPRVGALDEAWDVAEREPAVFVHGVMADVRLGGGKGVRRDLRKLVGHRGQERGLACVRASDEADVGNHLQLEVDPTGLALLTIFAYPRRRVPVRKEVRVAAPAPTAACHSKHLADFQQLAHQVFTRVLLRQQFVGTQALAIGGAVFPHLANVNAGPSGHVDDFVPAAPAPLVVAPAIVATLASVVHLPFQVLQARQIFSHPQIDVAAVAAIAAVRAHIRHVPLVVEGLATVAAAAAGDPDLGHVEIRPIAVVPKHHRCLMLLADLQNGVLRALGKVQVHVLPGNDRERLLARQRHAEFASPLC